jgi:hypothetical protein
MPPERAAQVLGAFLGLPALAPAEVVALDVDAAEALLRATTLEGDRELEKALFAHADAVTTRRARWRC